MLIRIIISVFWLLLGMINGIILAARVTPFNFTDFKLISDLLAMKSSQYVTFTESVIIVVGLAVLVVFLIVLALRGPKFHGKINRFRNLIGIVACVAAIPFITKAAIHSDILASYFGNLAQGYKDYGFVYSFSASVVDTGMSKPKDYNQSSIEEIKKSISVPKTTVTKKDEPNIIFVQLESFIDPNELTFLSYSKDPTPNFHKLRKNYTSGYLTVPVVGAGTANTEFEIMTGMNLKYFGLGEYPFKTALKENPTESIASDLKSIGYATHALHNNGGNFYSRATVFRNMGYDSFTSKEEINITKYNIIKSWPTDDILVNETKKLLDSTKNQSDYIYTITVQSHGSYPSDPVYTNPEIKVTGGKTEASNNQWTYYMNQIHEVDQYVGNLIKMLSKRKEKTMVVFYGDHLPTMGLENEDVKSHNLFHTVYATWDNFNLKKEKKDVTTYQLSSYITNRLGIHTGTMFTYHQSSMANKNLSESTYLKNQELLQYDLIYGKDYVNDEKVIEPSDMEMGTQPVTITSIKKEDESRLVKIARAEAKKNAVLSGTSASAAAEQSEEEKTPVISIKGKNFTPWSRVYVNGSSVSTTHVSGTELEISPDDISDGAMIVVQQMGSGGTVFRRSNTIMIPSVADLSRFINDPTTSSGAYSKTSQSLSSVEDAEKKAMDKATKQNTTESTGETKTAVKPSTKK